MSDVNDIKNFVDFLINKEQSGNSYTPDQFNLLLQRANLDLYKETYGLPEDYQIGAPFPRMGWQMTQKITDEMQAFLEEKEIPVDTNGIMQLPSDYINKDALWYRFTIQNKKGETEEKFARVEIVDSQQWADRSCHSIDVPSKRYPICRYKGGNEIQFLPKNLQRVVLSYFRAPIQPFWAFTIDPTTEQPVYDPANSIQPDWGVETHNDLVRLILSYVGLNLSDQQIIGYAETIKQKGV